MKVFIVDYSMLWRHKNVLGNGTKNIENKQNVNDFF